MSEQTVSLLTSQMFYFLFSSGNTPLDSLRVCVFLCDGVQEHLYAGKLVRFLPPGRVWF